MKNAAVVLCIQECKTFLLIVGKCHNILFFHVQQSERQYKAILKAVGLWGGGDI